MNYIDKNIKEIGNNNTIGMIIYKKENRFVIEYCSDDRIAIRKYELVWYKNFILFNLMEILIINFSQRMWIQSKLFLIDNTE